MFRTITVLLSLGALCHAAEYRYQDDRVALESAGNRGLSQADVTPEKPHLPPRLRPLPVYAREGRHPERKGSVERRVVKAQISGSRDAAVEAGFPLPQGGVFDPRHIRVLGEEGAEIPAQVSVTTFCPMGAFAGQCCSLPGARGSLPWSSAIPWSAAEPPHPCA